MLNVETSGDQLNPNNMTVDLSTVKGACFGAVYNDSSFQQYVVNAQEGCFDTPGMIELHA